jgi:hypothetical protein
MMTESGMFEALPLRRRAIVPINPEDYRIVAKNGEIKEVKANTAYEAFRLSGFSEAIRIERKAAVKKPVLSKTRFVDESTVVSSDTLAVSGQQSSMFSRKHPVVSAEDLDVLMRAANAINVAPPMPDEQAHPPQVITSPIGMEVHGDGFDEIIPATMQTKQMTDAKAALETLITVAADEPQVEETQAAIADVTQAASPPVVETPASVADAPQASPTDLPKEQELTQDEINKLLNG